MFSKAPEVGFHLVLSAQIDSELGDQVQLSANCAKGASAAEVASQIALMREAVWLERQAVNRRILAKAELLKRAVEERLAQFREQGKPVDEEMIEEEAGATNVTLARLRSQIEADERLASGVVKANGSGRV